MNALKSIGNFFFGIAIFAGIIIAAVLVFTLGAEVAFTIQPFVNWLAGILFIINLLALLTALVPKTRGVAGIVIYLSSYVYGLGTWIFGLAVTLALWGWIAVIVGVLMGGVGVVPVGLLAAIFHSEWSIFWTLLINIALTYSARIVGTLLVSNSENQMQFIYDSDEVIDIEPVIRKRTWKDVE